MEIKHQFEGDHDFFWMDDAPERSTGWVDGWRVEFDNFGEVEIVEFFDAEKNSLFDCLPIPGSDLAEALDGVAYQRFDVQ